MKKLSVGLLATSVLFVLQGCESISSWWGTSVKCERAVKYSGYKVEVTGFELPIEITGGSAEFKIGRASFEPQKIQEAKNLIGTIDLLQFSDCQTMLLIKDDTLRFNISERRRESMVALASVLSELDKSTTEEQHDKALENAKNIVGELQAKKIK
ncbi:MAG: hypothetical protein DU481_03570 [Nitrosomonas sp.]|uniref:hypothetical protein n=1 Tax=Nitrosomonas sp. TaxID=42353 RepID=UPI0032EC77DB